MLMPRGQAQALAIEAKRSKVLAWLKSEGFSTPPIIGQVLGFQRSATHKTLKDMEKAGLLQTEQIPAGAGTIALWGLTPHGAGMAVDPEDPNPDWSYFEPGRVSPLSVGHALDVQRVRLALTREGWTDWQSDRDCHRLQLAKIPDALTRDPAGQLVAIEVERTLKTQKRYRDIAAIYLQMVHAGTFDRVQYVCPLPGMSQRVSRLYSTLEYVVVQGKRVALEERHHAAFSFTDFSTKTGEQR